MIDLHSHILPGLDDGARTLDESIEIALSAVAEGTSVIAATPHVRDDFPTAAGTVAKLVSGLNRLLGERGIPLTVVPGAEIALARLPRLDEEELRALSLAGSGRYLLLEFPYYGWPLSLESDIHRLRNRGLTPVIAHPERSLEVQASSERMRALVDAGALIQVTAVSVDGRMGHANSHCAMTLIKEGLAHLIASDTHRPGLRRPGLRNAAEAVGDFGLARWLTLEVPAAIVAGETIPERPRVTTTTLGRLSGRLRRRPRDDGSQTTD